HSAYYASRRRTTSMERGPVSRGSTVEARCPTRGSAAARRSGVFFEPVAGDVGPTGEPDLRVALGVGDEAVQAVGPPGPAAHPAVQPERHHPWAGRALVVQLVEGLAGGLEEVLAGREMAPPELGVVDRQGVRHHQPLLLADHRVVGQVVVVGVAVIDEAAVLDHQLAGVLARTVAAVPAGRLLAGGAGQAVEAGVDRPPLGLAVHQVILLPPIAVAADVVALRGDRAGHGR